MCRVLEMGSSIGVCQTYKSEQASQKIDSKTEARGQESEHFAKSFYLADLGVDGFLPR